MNLSPQFSLFRSRRTILEFLEARKIPLPEEIQALKEETFEEFEENWAGSTTAEIQKGMIFDLPGKKGETIVVMWLESLGISDVQYVKRTVLALGGKIAIVVYNNKITPHAAAAIRCFTNLTQENKMTIETFCELDVQTNILKHEIQARFVVCSSKKKKEVLKAYAVNSSQIPAMKASDPVAKALGTKKGVMIKILRRSESIPEVEINGETKILYDVSYRVVS